MLRRKIDDKLEFWRVYRKQALLITGARQVGKSFAIDRFINAKFENPVKIDFAKRPDLIDTFANLENSQSLLIRLSLIVGNKMVPDKTVFFLDEIQLVYQRREELKKQGAIPSTWKRAFFYIYVLKLVPVVDFPVGIHP